MSGSNERLTLVATILGSSIAILDSRVVSVALPSIQRRLGGGLAGQQWVSNAYLLTLGSLILLGGSLGDIFGERRIFAFGVGGFGAASSALVVLGGLIGAAGIRNPRRVVRAQQCPGGQLAGAPPDAGGLHSPQRERLTRNRPA